MNLYAYCVLCFGCASFLIGLLIWIKLESRIGFYFFLFSALAGLWGMFSGQSLSNNFDYKESLFFARCANAAAIWIGPTWYHFTLTFSKRDNKKIFKVILYISYFIALTLTVFSFSNLLVSRVSEVGKFAYFPRCGPLYYFFTLLFFVSVPMGFVQLFKYLKQLSGKERTQCLWLICSTGAGFIGGSLTFPPAYGIPLPQYGMLIMPLYPLFMAISMMKFGLLTEENLILAAHKDKLAALGILTASINHEIRGPLFAMRGAVEGNAGDEQLKIKLLDQIDRLTGIVSRLTHFAKKGVDEEAKIEPLDLKEILNHVRPLLQHQLNYQDIYYEQNISSNFPKVLADRRYFEEILFNLLINACQALKEIKQGKIVVMAYLRNNQAVIEITDNGPGFTFEQTKHIFKPFHTTKTEGTGLGLYITKQLIEKCSGKIEVDFDTQHRSRLIVKLKVV